MEKTKVNIEIGTQATGWYYSDTYPYEVIAITPSGKTVTLRRLDATPTKNYNYFTNQEHTFTSNENNEVVKVRKNKYGQWKSGNLKVAFGAARAYEDPHF